MLYTCETWVLTNYSERKMLSFKNMLHKDYVNRMVPEGNKRGTSHKSEAKKKSTPGIDTNYRENCTC